MGFVHAHIVYSLVHALKHGCVQHFRGTKGLKGGVREWLKRALLKSAMGQPIESSNLSPSAMIERSVPVERFFHSSCRERAERFERERGGPH